MNEGRTGIRREEEGGESAVPLWFYQWQCGDNEDQAWPDALLPTNHVSAKAGKDFSCSFPFLVCLIYLLLVS